MSRVASECVGLEHFNFEMLCGRVADTREACHVILSITLVYVGLPMCVVK